MSLQQDNIAISMPPDEPANNSYIGRLKIKIGNINTFGLAAYICVFLIYLVINALPISELVIATKFKNDIDCESNVGVSLYQWLITDAAMVISLVGFIFLLFTIAFITNSNGMMNIMFVSFLLLIPYVIFNFAWLIVGSIIFWRDCVHVNPSEVNTIMWVVLLIKWIMMFLTLMSRSKKSEE
uniref:Uncharacterized protein n=1 Tax=viral metagenome TaxID=1070528 RepID=A0A6C0ECL6_9ZZZZ